MLSRLFNNWPLRRQIVLVTGGAILLFGLGAAQFVIQNETSAFERNFREQTDKLVRMLAATSLDAILSEDRPVLDTTIEVLVENDRDVEVVRIYTERDELLTVWQRDDSADLVNGKGVVHFSQDVVLEGDVYGRFEVSWNVARQHAEIAAAAQRVYGYAAGISILLALLIVTIVDRLVVAPTRAIHDQLRNLERGARIPRLHVAAARELVSLGESVNELGNVLELRRAKEIELEEVSRAKSELLANMSHELRTPMNGVLGMLALLGDSELNGTQASQVRIAASSGRSLLRLINDILDFSKVEAGKLEFESIAFDLEELVEETVEVFAEQAHSKGLELDFHVVDTLHETHVGDPTRLRQVLTNLVGNAIKFTAAGRVTIAVDRADTFGPPAPHRLRVEVVDTGVGIDPGAQRTIFDSFSQADGSTTRTYGGTGLGLAISRQLIEGMGGTIGVHSALGVGSEFWFELELEGAGRDLATRAIEAVEAGEVRRALVVDGSAGVADALAARLEAFGVQSESVRDGDTALERLRTAAETGSLPDLVFIDETLDGMPGEVLVRCIEADPAFDAARLIGLRRIGDSHDGLDPDHDARVAASLCKPVGRRALLALFTERRQTSDGELQDRAADRRERLARNAGLSILVVEDNPVNQEVALGMLERLGFRSEVVDNGQLALDRLATDDGAEFDLVLMDCQMPVLDGYATATAIREREARGGGARLPIVALTANAMDGDTEKCLAAGMDDYLAKPFDPDRLEEKLEHWLAPARAASEEDQNVELADLPRVAGGRG